MVQCWPTNEVALSCSSNATGIPHALSRRNTLQVVRLASAPLPEMMSCLAPSPAVMSSLETSATNSSFPAMRWIVLVLPSATVGPRECLERSAVLASTGECPVLGLQNIEIAQSWPRARAQAGLIHAYFSEEPGGPHGRRARNHRGRGSTFD